MTLKRSAPFYDRFEADVLAFVYRATRRADIAADLTAEIFAAALASAGAFDPTLGTARGWLFGIARHKLAQLWERGRVEDSARRRLGCEPLAITDELLERIEQLGSIGSVNTLALPLLEDLPRDQRLAIEGRVLEERDYSELAVTLSCSESVVRQRVSHGLVALLNALPVTAPDVTSCRDARPSMSFAFYAPRLPPVALAEFVPVCSRVFLAAGRPGHIVELGISSGKAWKAVSEFNQLTSFAAGFR
jgi:RNA polymerase sigma factor (sigma-70 family)